MVQHYYNVPLKGRNSFGVEATAAELIEYTGADDLRAIFAEGFTGRPWYLLSGGNNILFTADYPGVLLHPTTKGIATVEDDGRRVNVRVEAGEEWDDVVAWCVERRLWGVENLSLIPGYAGAAPVQNIGAYGAELKDVVAGVEVFMTDTLETRVLSPEECRFGYRDSIFKHELRGRAIITAVELALDREGTPNLSYGHLDTEVYKTGPATPENIRRAVIAIRRAKLPDPKERGNAGSFFKNPVIDAGRIPRLTELFPDMPVYPAGDEEHKKLSAAWLIDRAGWKGYTNGNVGSHPTQPLVLVNHGGATGREVLTFARAIQTDIASKFGIKIEMEVNVL